MKNNDEIRFSLSFEFPITEGYIWVQIDDGKITSAPVAMCLECGEERGIQACECTVNDCINCEHTIPEMIRRRERIEKIYTQLHPFLEREAIALMKTTEKELKKIDL